MKLRTWQVAGLAVALALAGGVAVAIASSQRNGDGRSSTVADASPSAPLTSSAPTTTSRTSPDTSPTAPDAVVTPDPASDTGPVPETSDAASVDRPGASASVSQSLLDSVRDPSAAVINAITQQIEALEAAGKKDEADRLKARRALLEANLRPDTPRIPRSPSPAPPGGTPGP